MAAPERIYWDSMMFTYRITGTHPDINLLKHISDKAEKGEIEIATSVFTLCEVAKIEHYPCSFQKMRSRMPTARLPALISESEKVQR